MTSGMRPEAYFFLNRALQHTQARLGREGHVTGRELLESFRQLALEEFGPMALVVLEHWGIRRTEDVGEMVRQLVESGVWSRSEQDSWNDFDQGFAFRRVFDEEYPWDVKAALRLRGAASAAPGDRGPARGEDG